MLIRRGRLRGDAERGPLFGSIELDGNTVAGATARVVSARAGARWRRDDLDASASLGLFKIPFGREVPAAEQDRAVLEPSTAARALFPGNHDAGALATARWRGVELAIAATNGAPSGDAQFHGRDPSASWDLIARAGARGELAPHVVLSGGVSALTGSGLHPGTPAIKDELSWVDANEDGVVQVSELTVIPGAPAEPAQRFHHAAVGADASITWCLRVLGRGELTLEGVLATNLDRGVAYADPIAASRDLRELGWQVMVAQRLTPHAQVAARYDLYRPDRDALEPEGQMVVRVDPRYATLAIAAEARTERARLIVEYDHEQNPDGRGVNGAPTTRAADRVTLRAQVAFR